MKYNVSAIILSGGFSLRPYNEFEAPANAETDALTFNALVSDDIRQFLPGLPIFSGTSADKYFKMLPIRMEMGAGITFAIRSGEGLVGLMILDSPLYNSRALGLEVWSLDFFILEPFRGRKIIMESLYRTLELCKNKLNIDKIYASVDKRNKKCIHVLEKFYFDHIQDDQTGMGALYELDLSTLNFK